MNIKVRKLQEGEMDLDKVFIRTKSQREVC